MALKVEALLSDEFLHSGNQRCRVEVSHFWVQGSEGSLWVLLCKDGGVWPIQHRLYLMSGYSLIAGDGPTTGIHMQGLHDMTQKVGTQRVTHPLAASRMQPQRPQTNLSNA